MSYPHMFVRSFVCLLALGITSNLSAQKPVDAPEAEVGSEIVVELIEAGNAPHRQLRFTPKLGDKLSKVMSMKMSQVVTVGGQQPPQVELPGQKMYMDMEVTNVDPNGDIDFQYSYVDIEVVSDPDNPSPIAAQMESMLDPMIGTKGTATITSRGLTKKSNLEISEDLNPMIKSMIDGMKDSMNKLSSPLPEEAVGVGGKWRTVQQLNANGISLEQTSTYEVTKLDSSSFTLSITVDQHAAPQEVKNAMLPPGAVMKLKTLDTKGEGTSRFELNNILPKSSTVSMNSTTSMSISVAGQNQEMTTDMNVEMTLDDAPEKQ
jgi:hypothetical protein